MAIDPNKDLGELLEKATAEDMRILSAAISPYIEGGDPTQILNLMERYIVPVRNGNPIETTRVNVSLINILNKYGIADITITEQPTAVGGGSFKINSINSALNSKDVLLPNTIGSPTRITIIVPSPTVTPGGYVSNGLDILKGIAISRVSSENQKDYDVMINKGVQSGTILLRVVEIDGQKVVIPLEFDKDATKEKREAADEEADKSGVYVKVYDEYTVVPPPCYLDPNCAESNTDTQTIQILNILRPGLTDSEIEKSPAASKNAMTISAVDQLVGNSLAAEGHKGNAQFGYATQIWDHKNTKKVRAGNAMLAKITGLIYEYTKNGDKLHSVAKVTKDGTIALRQIGNYGEAIIGTGNFIEGVINDNHDQINKGKTQISQGLLKEGLIFYGTKSLAGELATYTPRINSVIPGGRSTLTLQQWNNLKNQYPELGLLEGKGVEIKGPSRVTLSGAAQRSIIRQITPVRQIRVKAWIEFLIYLAIYGPDLLGYDAKSKEKLDKINKLRQEAADNNWMMGPYVQSGGTIKIDLEGPVVLVNPNGSPRETLVGLPDVLVGPGYDPDKDNGSPGNVTIGVVGVPNLDVTAHRGEGADEPNWLEEMLYGLSSAVSWGLKQLENSAWFSIENVSSSIRYLWETLNGYDEAASITTKFQDLRMRARGKFSNGEINKNELEQLLIKIDESESVERRLLQLKGDSSLLQNGSSDPTVNTNANLALEVAVAQDDYDRLAGLTISLVELGDQLAQNISSVPDIALSDINSDTTFVTNLSEFDRDSIQFSPPSQTINNGGCFVKGTLIDSINHKIEISELKIGDPVISFDKNGNLHIDVVSDVFTYTDRLVSEYIFENGHCLESTETHPILTGNNTFVPIGELNVGDIVIDCENNSIKLLKINQNIKTCDVFNIEVSNNHTYIANGIRVHNKLGVEYDNQRKDDFRSEINRIRAELNKNQEDFQNWVCEVMPWVCDPTQGLETPPSTNDLLNNVVITPQEGGDTQKQREAIITVGPARRVPVGTSQFIPEGTINNYMNSSVGSLGNQVPPEIQNPTNTQQLMGNTKKRP